METSPQTIIDAAPGVTLHRLGDAPSLLGVIENWHHDTHDGSWRMCMEQPCHAAKRFAVPVEKL